MRNELLRALRARRRALVRARMRRLASGLDLEADALMADALLQHGARLAPVEHWRPPDDGTAHLAARNTHATRAKPPARPLQLRDRVLLAIEVTAVVGLVIVTLQSFGILRRLQQDVRAMPAPGAAATRTAATAAWALRAPTATPLSPLATATVGPGGVAPPATASPSPTAVVTLTSTPPATATPGATPDSPTGVRFVIPAIRVDAPMVEGDDWETLKGGIGHRTGSAWPGQPGNTVISAHNDVYGSIFRDLNTLRPGDLVYAHTPTGVYRYQVVSSRIVLPTEVSVTEPSEEPILTMITCYPPLLDTHRIVVTARLLE